MRAAFKTAKTEPAWVRATPYRTYAHPWSAHHILPTSPFPCSKSISDPPGSTYSRDLRAHERVLFFFRPLLVRIETSLCGTLNPQIFPPHSLPALAQSS